MPGESRPAGIQSSLLSPLLAETESPFDLEQQWQDLMSIMEMQVSCRRGAGRRLPFQGNIEFMFRGPSAQFLAGHGVALVAAVPVLRLRRLP